jgi:hypothetical protein
LVRDRVDRYQFRKCHSFHDARTFVRSLELRNQDEWRRFCRGNLPEKGTRPSDITTNTHTTYPKSGWVNTADWIGKQPPAARKVQKQRKAQKLDEGPIVDGLKMMMHLGRLGALGEG